MIAGTLEIQLMADVARIKADMDQAKSIIGGTMSAINDAVGLAMKGIALLGVAVSVDHFRGLIMGAIEAQAELKRMSDRTGATVETLSGLKGVAKLSQTSMEDVGAGVQKLAKAMVAAESGSGKQAEAFAKLGISSKTLAENMGDPGKMMLVVAKAMDAVNDGARKDDIAMAIMGKSGANLLPMMKDLAAAGELHGKVTTKQAEEAEKFMRTMAAWNNKWKELYSTIAVEILPVLNDFFGAMVKGGGVAKTFTGYVKELAASGQLRAWAETAKAGIDLITGAIVPAAKVAAAYFAIYVAAPAIFAAVSTAAWSLISAVAVYTMNVMIGQTATIGWNTALFGTSVAANLATGSLTKMALAGNVLFAAFAGWQIGTYLSDQFVEVRLAGLAMVGGLLVGWENIKYSAEMQFEAIKFAWDKTISTMKGAFGTYLSGLAAGFEIVGMKETGAQIGAYAASLKNAAAAQKTFAQQTAGLTTEHAKAVAAIQADIGGMMDYEAATAKATKAVAAQAAAKKGRRDLTGGAGASADEAYRAAIALLDGLQKQEQANLRQHLYTLDSLHKMALVGDQEFENRRYALELDSIAKMKVLDQQKMAEAVAAGQVKDVAKYMAAIKELDNQVILEKQKHYDNLAMIDKHSQDIITTNNVAAMKARGDIVGAFQEEFYRKNGDEILKAERDNNTKLIASIEAAYTAGLAGANFDQTKAQFEAQMAGMVASLNAAKDAAALDGGLAAAINAKGIADDISGKSIPALHALQQSMLAAAKASGDLGKIKVAIDFGKSIDDEAKKLRGFATDVSSAWKKAGDDIAKSLGSAFGQVGKDAGALLQIMMTGIAAQSDLDAKYAEAKKAQGADLAALEKQYNAESIANTLDMYGNMAGSIKNYFDEKSGAYRAFAEIERAMHIASLLMNAEKIISNLATIPAAIAAGASQMFAQSGWLGFAGVAAMIAVMASLGASSSGSASGMSAPEMQKQQGTGTVMGDDTAKSDSVQKSLDLLAKNSDITLPYTQQMTRSLQTIESGIGGLANLVYRSGGTTGTVAGFEPSKSYNFTDSLNTLFGGPLKGLGNKISEALFGSVEKTLIDSGFLAKGTFGQLSAGQGLNQYGAVKTEEKAGIFGGLFGGSNSTSVDNVYQELPEEMKRQFGLIFSSIGTSLKAAASALGLNGDEVIKALNRINIDLPLSIKDLKGAELETAINNWLSKIGDTAAQAVIPGLDDFQKVGEGYYQTIIRVATGTEQAGHALDYLGIKAIGYTEILNKQGDVMTEIARQSIVNFETTGHAAIGGSENISGMQTVAPQASTLVTSGIGKIIDNFGGSGQDLIALYKTLTDIREQFRAYDAQLKDVTIDMIDGAKGLDALKKGVADFYSKFYTAGEQTSAQGKILASTFAGFGETLPATREGFRSLAEGIDTSTAAGQKLYGQVIANAGAADQYYAALEKLSTSFVDSMSKLRGAQPGDSAQGVFDSSFTALQKVAPWITSYNQLLTMSKEDFQHLTPVQQESVNLVLQNAVALKELNAQMLANFRATTQSLTGGSPLPNLTTDQNSHIDALLSSFGGVGRSSETLGAILNMSEAEYNGLTQAQKENVDAVRNDEVAIRQYNQALKDGQLSLEESIMKHNGATDMQIAQFHRTNAAADVLGLGIHNIGEATDLTYLATLHLTPAQMALVKAYIDSDTAVNNLSSSINKMADAAASAGISIGEIYSAAETALNKLMSDFSDSAKTNSGGDYGKELSDTIAYLSDQIPILQQRVQDLISQQGGFSYGNTDGVVTHEILLAQQKLEALTKDYLRYVALESQYAGHGQALLELEKWHDQQKELMAGNSEALAALELAYGKKRNDIINGVLSSGLTQTVEALRKFGESLRAWLRGLDQNSALSPLTAQQQKDAAYAVYMSDLTKANAGDMTAQAAITKDAEALLNAQKAISGFGGEYSAIFAMIKQNIGDLANIADPAGAPPQTVIAPVSFETTNAAIRQTTEAAQETTQAVKDMAAELADTKATLARLLEQQVGIQRNQAPAIVAAVTDAGADTSAQIRKAKVLYETH